MKKTKMKAAPPVKALNLKKFIWGGCSAAVLLLVPLIFESNLSNLNFSLSSGPAKITVQQKTSSLIPEIKKEASPTATQKEVSKPYIPHISGKELNVPILMYHYIGNNPNPKDVQRDSLSVTPDKFNEQMKYLSSNGYNTTTFDILYAALHNQTTLPNKTIILTFDDGYVDFYFNAYPILRQYNLKATSFILTGLLGQGAYLNWSQIKEMNASGLISFQAHTVHHYHLPSLDSATAKFELSESKRVLESELGIKVNFLAYPYGSVDNRIIELTKEAGFVGAVGTWSNKLQSEGTIYNMPRLRVGGGTSLEAFKTFL